LSSKPLDVNHPGYQVPLPKDMVTPLEPGEEPMRGMRNLEGGNRPRRNVKAKRNRKKGEEGKEGDSSKKPKKRNNRRKKAVVKDKAPEEGTTVKVEVVEEAAAAKPVSTEA